MNVDPATPSQQEPTAKNPMGYVAFGLGVFSMLVPLFLSYLVFAGGLVAGILALSKRAPWAKIALIPLVLSGCGLVYSTITINRAAQDLTRSVQELQQLTRQPTN